MSDVRIIDQATDTALQAGDFVIVDSTTEGSRKYDLGSKLVSVDSNIENKVDRITGKGLSTEDYTTEEKTKLSNIDGDVMSKWYLEVDEIPNTTQSYTRTNGRVTQITHTRSGVAIRTDAFTYGSGMITETRTLSTGEVLTITTNLSTLETTVTYTAV